MSQKYPVRVALGAAIQAFDVNQFFVQRDYSRDSTGEILITPNRVLMLDYLKQDTVSDEQLTKAEDIVIFLQQTCIMQTLANGKSDQFLSNMVELLTNETVTHRDFGLLAWAPKLARDLQKRADAREVSAMFERTSNYVGCVGERVDINFTAIDSRYHTNMNCYAVYGHDNNHNLIFYWANDINKVVTNGFINGRVKSHYVDDLRNKARITALNYVKVVK